MFPLRRHRRSPRTTILPALLLATVSLARAGTSPVAYPPAPRAEVVDDLHGTSVADPFRPLEDGADERTRAWLAAEARLARERLDGIAERGAIRRRLEELSSGGTTGVPWRAGGRLFFLAGDGRGQQPVLYAQETIDGEARPVLDPDRISPDGTIEVREPAVSRDGRLLAYLTARGGEDLAEVRVRDLASGRDLADAVPGVLNAVCWQPDGGGFDYVVPGVGVEDGEAGAPGAARPGKRVLRHRLGEPVSADTLVVEFGAEARWAYCMTSEDGRWALYVAEKGGESEVVALDLAGPAGDRPFPLLAGRRGYHTPIDFVGHELFLRTNLDAPRGRVVALDLRRRQAAEPRPVVGEAEEPIEDAAIAGDRLVLHVLRDVQSRLRRFTLAGEPAGEIALPDLGAVGWPLSARPSSPELFFTFSSFLAPDTVHRCAADTGSCAPFRAPAPAFEPSRYETRQIFFISADGTRIPMFVTAARGLALDGSHPALLTAYGGYGASYLPGFDPQIPLWLERGGVWAVANLRGGGEYGEAWHRAGMLERKQTSFDDFFAAARYLVAEGWTSHERLAIYGHSNGGLLVGAALTQRPELFAVAVADAGHYDMLRYHRFTAGAGWTTEYGSPDDPAAFPALRAYSPLHNVRAGTCYPATLLLAADRDDRVVPAHAYKFAAALQEAQGCDRPILLRVATDASHGYASRREELDQRADLWAFVVAGLAAAEPSRPRASSEETSRPPGRR